MNFLHRFGLLVYLEQVNIFKYIQIYTLMFSLLMVVWNNTSKSKLFTTGTKNKNQQKCIRCFGIVAPSWSGFLLVDVTGSSSDGVLVSLSSSDSCSLRMFLQDPSSFLFQPFRIRTGSQQPSLILLDKMLKKTLFSQNNFISARILI